MTQFDPWVNTSVTVARRRARRRARLRRRRATVVVAFAAVLLLVALLNATGTGRAPVTAAAGPKPTAPARRGVTATRGGLLARENAAIDRLLRRQPFISSGGPQRREIALTFDDGPGPYTPGLLDQLQRLHVPATFFEVGFTLRYFSSSLRRELRMGAGIGNHTETHPIMAHLTASKQTSQILAQREKLARYGAGFPRLYRPPYGRSTRLRSRSCIGCTC